jgi:DNA-binding IclR family transcriptional regulator
MFNKETSFEKRKMISKALALLEAIAEARKPLGVSHLSKRLDMPIATVHRQLRNLIDVELVQQDSATGRYVLGSRAYALASTIGGTRPDQVQKVLRELNQKTSYSTLFSQLNGTSITYLTNLPSTTAISVGGRIGGTGPLHSTAMGKAILAQLDPSALEALLQQIELTAHTPMTITNRDDLRSEIAQIRERGYAIQREENEAKVCSIAYPVNVGHGATRSHYAVCISSHISEFDELSEWIDELHLTAVRLEGLI